MGETRKQLKERLQRTGLWQRFLGLREQLKREVRTPRQAHEEALAQIESRPPQLAAPNPAPVTDGEQNESDLSRLVIDIPLIERIAWEQTANKEGLSLLDWIRGRCGPVAAKPCALNPYGLCTRCWRIAKSGGCPNFPKNIVLERVLSSRQAGILQTALAEALRRIQALQVELEAAKVTA
jgi:hypothetical protein